MSKEQTKPHYMIVWKPLGSKCWTPITEDMVDLHDFAVTNWSQDLLRVTKICQHLNGLEHRVWMAGIKAWDIAVFRVATVTIADSESIAMPSGEAVKA